MRFRFTIATLCVLALIAGTATAQTTKKYEINGGGGFTAATGDIEEHFGNGGHLEAGFTFYPSEHFGLQVQYAYTKLNGKDFTLPVAGTPGGATLSQDFSSHMHMHGFSFDAVIRPKSINGAYFVAGPGIYHRNVSLTSPAVGFVTVCDPFWLVCVDTPTSVDRLLGDRGSTDFGLNGGGGFAFKISDSAKLYAEARYLYVWGPDVNVNGTTKANANGQFIPLSFGIRW
jgi:opacity protein-like surface antigen